MAGETIELAKNYEAGKSLFPAFASLKYDGVPLRFVREGNTVVAYTRQGEVAGSVDHLRAVAAKVLTTEGGSFVAECLVPGYDFKDSSGIIRRSITDGRIIGYIFDADVLNRPKMEYFRRIDFLGTLIEAEFGPADKCMLRQVSYELVVGPMGVKDAWEAIKRSTPTAEGMMLHHTHKAFQPGKRCWGMTRYKPQPTIDLEVTGFEEAISEDGRLLGMVGRINVRLLRRAKDGGVAANVVGIGPGKLKHNERIAIWNGQSSYIGKIAEIKYMPDPSYDALRQPTFQCFRYDKVMSDVLEY